MRHYLAQATLDKLEDHPDEPVFVLRAQDKLADRVVDFWAQLAAEELGDGHEKVLAAREIAMDMRDHPTRKIPD